MPKQNICSASFMYVHYITAALQVASSPNYFLLRVRHLFRGHCVKGTFVCVLELFT